LKGNPRRRRVKQSPGKTESFIHSQLKPGAHDPPSGKKKTTVGDPGVRGTKARLKHLRAPPQGGS